MVVENRKAETNLWQRGAPLSDAGLKIEKVNATPRKSFFVEMLTRDIELQDVILDLLDNCVDGILRNVSPDLKQAQPYKGFWAVILVGSDGFVIADNCGGIPFEIARDSAFAIGKTKPIEGEDAIATVGMYGIGMKRAIFKLGRDATVRSFSDLPFEVRITPEWMANDGWDQLTLVELAGDELKEKGTSVSVRQLDAIVAREFSRPSFIDEIEKTIGRQFGLIIEKGFEISVAHIDTSKDEARKKPIKAEPFRLLKSSASGEGTKKLTPYFYNGKIDGVDVEIYAGLYRELPSEEEREREEETRGSTDSAGWTVACNDRIVVWKDRSRLTGWGEASTPNYHGQFIAITGIVLLRSKEPGLLPLTTTKRGIDASSDVYSKCKDLMREATKALAGFTNKWKNFTDEREKLYQDSEYLDIPSLRQEAKRLDTSMAMRAIHNMPTVKKYAPTLPLPTQAKTHARIGFNAKLQDVSLLGRAYFEDANAKPAAVGQHAFELELARVRGR